MIYPDYKNNIVNIAGSIEKYFDLKSDVFSLREIDEVLKISRDYFENKEYKVYFTNAEFEYQNAKRRVESNEYMIAFKD